MNIHSSSHVPRREEGRIQGPSETAYMLYLILDAIFWDAAHLYQRLAAPRFLHQSMPYEQQANRHMSCIPERPASPVRCLCHILTIYNHTNKIKSKQTQQAGPVEEGENPSRSVIKRKKNLTLLLFRCEIVANVLLNRSFAHFLTNAEYQLRVCVMQPVF